MLMNGPPTPLQTPFLLLFCSCKYCLIHQREQEKKGAVRHWEVGEREVRGRILFSGTSPGLGGRGHLFGPIQMPQTVADKDGFQLTLYKYAGKKTTTKKKRENLESKKRRTTTKKKNKLDSEVVVEFSLLTQSSPLKMMKVQSSQMAHMMWLPKNFFIKKIYMHFIFLFLGSIFLVQNFRRRNLLVLLMIENVCWIKNLKPQS